jgi:hypothetical protein
MQIPLRVDPAAPALLACRAAERSRRPVAALLAAAVLSGCASVKTTDPIDAPLDGIVLTAARVPHETAKAVQPSNDRDWEPNQARLATAEVQGSRVTIRNIRNTQYHTADDYTVRYYEKTFDLDKLKTVDFIMVPFPEMPALAHTMLSFGFDDRDFVAVSVETRREKGETFGTMKGFFNQYEIIYIVGDERDLIRLRTDFWMNDVYLYRTRATPEQARDLFVDVMQRVNQLAARPEFYHTVTNNCTTNIRGHINRLFPDRIPYNYEVLLTGYSDRLAYDLDLVDTTESYPEAREHARVNDLAYRYGEDPDFSVKIRQGLAERTK